MFQRGYGLLKSLGLLMLVLGIAGCGSTRVPAYSGTAGGTSANIASGPILGSWWDSSAGGLRNVYGVTGAAYQGQAVYNDGEYAGAGVCMRADIALLTTASGTLYLTDLRQGIPVQLTSRGIPKAQIVFSPSCTSALAYRSGAAGALLLKGLLSSSRTAAAVTIPASASSAAVSDSGSILAVAPLASGASTVEFLASGGSAFETVAQLAQFGGMAFLPGSDAALLADAEKNTIREASQIGAGPSFTQIAGAAAGVAHPVAVAVSADGHAAAVALQSGGILRIDLSGQAAPVETACQCSPSELQPLAGNLVFRLNEAGSGTVWAYDGDARRQRIVFIPTDQIASQTGAAVKGAAR